jgi:hypothetical protein
MQNPDNNTANLDAATAQDQGTPMGQARPNRGQKKAPIPVYEKCSFTNDEPTDPDHPHHPVFIAKTIKAQISAGDGLALMAWGAESFMALQAHKKEESYYLGGLLFRVNGAKVKGWVAVKLNGRDEYEITIWSTANGGFDLVYLNPEAYCDELAHLIDVVIERDCA